MKKNNGEEMSGNIDGNLNRTKFSTALKILYIQGWS